MVNSCVETCATIKQLLSCGLAVCIFALVHFCLVLILVFMMARHASPDRLFGILGIQQHTVR